MHVFWSALKFARIEVTINTAHTGHLPLSFPTTTTDYVHVTQSRRSPCTNLNSRCILVRGALTIALSRTIYHRAFGGTWQVHVPISHNKHVVSFSTPSFLRRYRSQSHHKIFYLLLSQRNMDFLICSLTGQAYVYLYGAFLIVCDS